MLARVGIPEDTLQKYVANMVAISAATDEGADVGPRIFLPQS